MRLALRSFQQAAEIPVAFLAAHPKVLYLVDRPGGCLLQALQGNGAPLITVLILQDRGKVCNGRMVNLTAASVSVVILLSVKVVPMRSFVDVLGLRHFLEQNDAHLLARLGMHYYNNSLVIIRAAVTLSVGSSSTPGIG